MDEIRDLIGLLLEIDPDAMTRIEAIVHHYRVECRVNRYLEEAARAADPHAEIPDPSSKIPSRRIIH